METRTLSRADTMAVLARRLRERFGSRILRLYALREDPHEPETMGFAITLVAVSDEIDPGMIIDLTTAVNQELGYAYPVFPYVISSEEFEKGETGPACAARQEGVEL